MHEDEHAENCFKRHGRFYRHIHNYLDQYFQDFGPSHRRLLHHKKGVELIVKKFSEEDLARTVAEQHILEDLRTFDLMITEIPEDWKWYGDLLFFPDQHRKKLIGKRRAKFKKLYPEDF